MPTNKNRTHGASRETSTTALPRRLPLDPLEPSSDRILIAPNSSRYISSGSRFLFTKKLAFGYCLLPLPVLAASYRRPLDRCSSRAQNNRSACANCIAHALRSARQRCLLRLFAARFSSFVRLLDVGFGLML